MVKGVPSDKVGLPFFCFTQRRKNFYLTQRRQDAKKQALPAATPVGLESTCAEGVPTSARPLCALAPLRETSERCPIIRAEVFLPVRPDTPYPFLLRLTAEG